MKIKISRKQIDEIVEKYQTEGEIVISLYQFAYPDWDSIEKINGFPRCGKDVNQYIFNKLFEKKCSGLVWMNQGFSTHGCEDLGWKIDTSGVVVERRS